MNSVSILATNWNDFAGQIIDGWWGELAGPYRLAFAVLTVVTTWPWVVRVIAKRRKRGTQPDPVRSPRTAAFSFLGGLMVFGAIICFAIRRWNYMKLMELNRQVEAYRQENPISSTFFGVPVSDQAQAEAKSLAAFAYSFTPPLTSLELLVFVGFFGGLVLLNYPRLIFSPDARGTAGPAESTARGNPESKKPQ